MNWDAFDTPTIGRGSVQFAYGYNHYGSQQSGASLSSRLNALSAVNDSGSNSYTFNQLTYTHEFPGNWLQVTAGQFQIGGFDSNQYAGNQQLNFVNFALSQNASQAYVPASLGGYVQVNPTGWLSLAGGFQDANNTTGAHIQTSTFGNGQYAWFAYAQLTPTIPGLGSGQYSVLVYEQPSVPSQPQAMRGWSVNLVQNIDDQWGLFARLNGSTGNLSPIQTSLAGGVVVTNPLGGTRGDQIGLGAAWNRTNRSAFVGQSVRSSEMVAEVYWNVVVAKLLQVGPSVQVIFNPALKPGADTAGVFTLRVTGLF